MMSLNEYLRIQEANVFIIRILVNQTLPNINIGIKFHKMKGKGGVFNHVFTSSPSTLQISPSSRMPAVSKVFIRQRLNASLCGKVEAERKGDLPKDTWLMRVDRAGTQSGPLDCKASLPLAT